MTPYPSVKQKRTIDFTPPPKNKRMVTKPYGDDHQTMPETTMAMTARQHAFGVIRNSLCSIATLAVFSFVCFILTCGVHIVGPVVIPVVLLMWPVECVKREGEIGIYNTLLIWLWTCCMNMSVFLYYCYSHIEEEGNEDGSTTTTRIYNTLFLWLVMSCVTTIVHVNTFK